MNMTSSATRKTAAPSPSCKERIRGCLLAGACGDALGNPAEFYSLSEITEKYGPAGIRDFVDAYHPAGFITDDTQMTLFTAEGLLLAQAGAVPGDEPVKAVHRAYMRWLLMQQMHQGKEEEPPLPCNREESWLFAEKALGERRAPGRTCMGALQKPPQNAELGTRAENNSKGCGTVMRVAPVGLLAAPEAAYQLGCEVSALTHGHPTGQIAGGFLARLICCLLDEQSLGDAIDEACKHLRSGESAETLQAVLAACKMAQSHPDGDAVPFLGEGWVAEEALAIALYAVLSAPSLEEAIIIAVNHSGDSDSTGSMAGHIAGTLYGEQAIPDRWLRGLELHDVIAAMADRIVAERKAS